MTYGDAVRRYKELVAANDEAVNRMRAHDESLLDGLGRDLTAARRRLAEATERERVTRSLAAAYWESVVEQLWKERWLKVGPPPEPVPVGPDVDTLTCEAEAERAYAAVQEALRKQPLLPRRKP